MPLNIIFNLSIDTSTLPRQWRDAIICPIYKKYEKRNAANYRPVSLTSIVCKILERVIVQQLVEHIKMNHLDCEQQHGFTTGKSVNTNILEALDIWSEALMHNIPVDVIYLDYAKAFDTVPHQRLLKQVESFGIKDKALAWITAFLDDRRQKVSVHGEQSNWCSVLSGIPQGSVLGPILFTMFVSDVPGIMNNLTSISMLADDTKLYATLTDDNNSPHSLQEDLTKLQEWSLKMQMNFHPDKCHVLHLGQSNPQNIYHMNNASGDIHMLDVVTSEKELGVTIDHQLKFSDHIENAVKKANRVLGCLARTFRHLNKETFLLLYKSLVRPHLEYASCVWCPHLKKNRDLIEQVQRRATRLVPETKGLPHNSRLIELQLPTLNYRRQRTDIIQTFKIIKRIDSVNQDCRCPQCPSERMFQKASGTTRGHSEKLQTQRATGYRHHFFATRVVKMWNSLSDNTVQATTVNELKSRLRRDWRGHPDLYNYNFTN